MSDFLDTLNDRQRQAVCHEDGGLLVLAGAGTGKTRVLTHRCAWLMRERNCTPRQILAVTFTNKAAKEMRERIAKIVPFGVNELAIGTFHGICHRMLRRHAEAAGWNKNFQILDTQDQKSFIKRLLKKYEFDETTHSPSDSRSFINSVKEKGWRAVDITEAAAENPDMRRFASVYKLYEEECRREHKMDFTELLLSAVDLLRSNQDLCRHYAERFRHILIDEMQDTNPMQYDWLKLLDSGDNHYFAVGDDDQSIYAFRGANPGNMRKIQNELRAAKIVRLEENYRSTSNILNAANNLILINRDRLGKKLYTRDSKGASIHVTRYHFGLGESKGVATIIRDKIDKGENADDIAVLYRTNAQSRLLEKSLIEKVVPYRIYGGTRFFERQEIKHALSYLRLVVTDDNDSLLRVINMPPRGIGARTIESLVRHGNITEGMQKSEHPKVIAFRLMLEKWRAMYNDSDDEILPLLARAVVQQSGLLEHYESRLQDQQDQQDQQSQRVANLHEFVSAAEQFEKDEDDEDTLSAFLANAVLQSGEAEGGTASDKGAVNLMTVHASKGLEFSTVFVVGLEQGIFPSSQSLDSCNTADVEEERRLMYVAITRAKEKLFLSHADLRKVFIKSHGQSHFGERPMVRSLFIDELPSALLEIVDGHDILCEPQNLLRVESRGAASLSHTENIEKAIKKGQQSSVSRGKEIEPPPVHGGIAADDNPQYRLGVLVNHPKYGNGVLIRREGRGDDLKVEVTFKRVGRKTFLLSASPLSLI